MSFTTLRKDTIATMPGKQNKVRMVSHILNTSENSAKKTQNTSIDGVQSSQINGDLSKNQFSSSDFLNISQY
jgi:hypothetical protein